LIRPLVFTGLLLTLFSVQASPSAPQTDATLWSANPTNQAWPVTQPLNPPEGLRPCCAFGYNLKAEALGVPVPFYQLGNVIDTQHLGEHHYNDSNLGAVTNLLGINSEKVGLIYTRRGGFIDLAHVRDTADNTFYLFSQILPQLGQRWRIDLQPELALRRIQFTEFTAPADPAERYALATYLAGKLAFQLAAWHEIAQWYGFQSVPGFSEGVSAFSPEDLYSNLLGAHLAIQTILTGHAQSVSEFNQAMTDLLPTALAQLDAVSVTETRVQFDLLDGNWWDSHKRVPEKFLVLKRNYDTSDDRLPTPVPDETLPPQRLGLPDNIDSYPLSALAALQLWPGSDRGTLPPSKMYFTEADFAMLALQARSADAQQILQKR
jgi:hypothetical protein